MDVARVATVIDGLTAQAAKDRPAERVFEDLAAGLKKKLDALVARREKREPLQYVTGTVEFSGLRLEIDRRALVPRPETEMLVEAVLKEKTDGPARALDACTGSGAVALALKKSWGALEVTGADLSRDALLLARANALRLGLETHWVRADLFGPFVRPFHFITVNPPYIAEAEFAGLQPEVRDWEPRGALVAGPEGTEVLSRIPAEAAPLLWPGGLIAVEYDIALHRTSDAGVAWIWRVPSRTVQLQAGEQRDIRGFLHRLVIEALRGFP